jgi:hypothetical protein
MQKLIKELHDRITIGKDKIEIDDMEAANFTSVTPLVGGISLVHFTQK